MNPYYPTLFSPCKIGNVVIKNRICKAPQTTGLSHMDGTVSSRLVRCYEDLARGEVGMIIVEYAYVDRKCSKSASNQLGICDDEYIVGLGWLADTIKNLDCVPCIQIEHCGRQRFLGPPMKSASSNPWPLMYERYGKAAIPEELTIEEIDQLVEDFGKAAWRAKTAGFQVVEIHGAHGYLITNFLSPFTNQRRDWYGGSRENRFRFLEQVFKRCKEYVGEDFPIIVRLSGTDYEPGGMTIEDTIYYAKRLEELGCAAIDVSGGDHHQMIHQVTPMQLSRGHNVWAAEAIKKEVGIPVFATGSITQPDYAEEILASGKADFISMGRPLLADPYWAKKAMEGHAEDISPCIRCNEGCLDRGNHLGKSINCTMNPTLGFEDALAIRPAAAGTTPAGLRVPGADRPEVSIAVDALRPDGIRPTGEIVVIGGGLIGVETAIQFSRTEGNHVTIIEMLPRIMNGCSDCDHIVYTDWIREKNIRVCTCARVTEIGEEGVTFEAGGRRQTVPADHVFLATGMKPCGGLYEQLCAEGVKAYIVGDCQTPGKIYDAIHSGYKAGLKV